MLVKKKRTIGPCRGVTWLYYVVLLWSRDFFPPLYLDPRFRPLLLKSYSMHVQLISRFRCFVRDTFQSLPNSVQIEVLELTGLQGLLLGWSQ